MNDSKEFQDVESVCSGKLSRVPSQPAVVPSPRGMLGHDQACDLTHGTCLTHRETFFESPLAVIDSSSTHYRGMLHSWNLNATDGHPVRPSTERLVAGSEERNRDTFPPARCARRPSTRNSLFPAEGAYPQNCMVDQRKLQILELHFDKFPHLQRFHVGRYDSKPW